MTVNNINVGDLYAAKWTQVSAGCSRETCDPLGLSRVGLFKNSGYPRVFSGGPRLPTGFPGPDPSHFPFTVEESIPIFAIINKCAGRFLSLFFSGYWDPLGPVGLWSYFVRFWGPARTDSRTEGTTAI